MRKKRNSADTDLFYTLLFYSGSLSIRTSMVHENVAVLTGRIKFHDWSKLSEVLTYVSQLHF